MDPFDFPSVSATYSRSRSVAAASRSLVFVVALLAVMMGCGNPPEPATLALLGGKVVTMDPNKPLARAVAVRGDRIIAVGSDDEIARLLGPATEVLPLDGRMVLPGFIESHGHLVNLVAGHGEKVGDADLRRCGACRAARPLEPHGLEPGVPFRDPAPLLRDLALE